MAQSSAPMFLYEAVAQGLIAEQVEAVFGLFGDGNLRLAGPFENVGIELYTTRHESTAISMADGYARSTGRVGVATITKGPAVTNSLTSITAAVRGGVPLVILAGSTEAHDVEHIQWMDQESAFALTGAGVEVIPDANRILEGLATAFRRARDEARPIAINLTERLQNQRCQPQIPESTVMLPGVMVAPDEQLAEAAGALLSSQRPVILAGLGAVRSGAREELVRLGEMTGALLGTTLRAKGLFSGEPFDVDVVGGFSRELTAKLVGDADLIAVFGASLNVWTTQFGRMFSPEARIVQIDVDGSSFQHDLVDVPVVGDATDAAKRLAHLLEPHGHKTSGFRTSELIEQLQESRSWSGGRVTQHEDRWVDPRDLMAELDRTLPEHRTIVTDGGHFCGFPAQHLSVTSVERYQFACEFGSVGLGLGTAMGAAVGDPDAVTVAVVGDGGLMMNLGDLHTLARYALPIVVVIMDDGGFGAEVHFAQMHGLPDGAARYDNPSFAGISSAMGVRAATVDSPSGLADIAGLLADRRGPIVLDCKIDPTVRARWLEEFASAYH